MTLRFLIDAFQLPHILSMFSVLHIVSDELASPSVILVDDPRSLILYHAWDFWWFKDSLFFPRCKRTIPLYPFERAGSP